MDYLENAKKDIAMAVGELTVNWDRLAIANALIALVEEQRKTNAFLEALTSTVNGGNEYTAPFISMRPL